MDSEAHALYARRVHTGTALMFLGVASLCLAAFLKSWILVIPAIPLFIGTHLLTKLATDSHKADFCPGCDRGI